MAKQGSLFKFTITIIAIMIIVLYGFFNSRLLRKGPTVQIFDLVDGQVFQEENIISISGRADNISFLTLNDRPIFINEEGLFNEKVLLSNKINFIEIYAEDRFGKTTVEKMKLVYINDEEIKIPIIEVPEEEEEDADVISEETEEEE